MQTRVERGRLSRAYHWTLTATILWMAGWICSTEEMSVEAAAAIPHALGMAAYERGEYDEAVMRFTEVIASHPEAVAPYVNRGMSYAAIACHDEALADFDHARQLDPALPSPLAHRAALHWEREEYEAAIADYTAALELDPNNAELQFSRAQANHLCEHYTEAVADYSRVIERYPQAWLALINRASVYDKLGLASLANADVTVASRLAARAQELPRVAAGSASSENWSQ